MVNDIVLIGSGGFGREVLWLIKELCNKSKWNILGFIDNNSSLKGKEINGYPVLGTDEWILNYSKKLAVCCCIGNSKTRKNIINRLSINNNIWFPTIISDNVLYSRNISMGQGCIICSSNILTTDISLGNFIILNLNCTIGHDSKIKDFVTVHPGVNISGNVRINECSEIGTGSCIIPNINVGSNSIIGAGSVVINNVPDNSVVVGNPAIVKKYL